jgi:methylated-DNA-[protein]-cysteine S-methyltransferase
VSSTEIIVVKPLALRLEWNNEVLKSIRLTWAADTVKSKHSTPTGRKLEEALAKYVTGAKVDWPELPVDLSVLPAFHKTVLEELARIPAGKVMSYGELAAKCGSPKAARAVGQVMAKNPWPLVYPCHRVLASGGGLGGFGPGLEMKKWLLELEGAL